MVTGVKKKDLLKDSRPTYGLHKMARVKQDVLRTKKNNSAIRQRIITKQNTYRSSTSPVKVSKGRELLTPEKKTAFSSKETGDRIAKVTRRSSPTSSNPKSGVKKSPQVSTARPSQKPSVGQGYSTRQSLKQTRPKQSARLSSTLQRAQQFKKNTLSSSRGQSVKSQPLKNQQKWVSR